MAKTKAEKFKTIFFGERNELSQIFDLDGCLNFFKSYHKTSFVEAA